MMISESNPLGGHAEQTLIARAGHVSCLLWCVSLSLSRSPPKLSGQTMLTTPMMMSPRKSPPKWRRTDGASMLMSGCFRPAAGNNIFV